MDRQNQNDLLRRARAEEEIRLVRALQASRSLPVTADERLAQLIFLQQGALGQPHVGASLQAQAFNGLPLSNSYQLSGLLHQPASIAGLLHPGAAVSSGLSLQQVASHAAAPQVSQLERLLLLQQATSLQPTTNGLASLQLGATTPNYMHNNLDALLRTANHQGLLSNEYFYGNPSMIASLTDQLQLQQRINGHASAEQQATPINDDQVSLLRSESSNLKVPSPQQNGSAQTTNSSSNSSSNNDQRSPAVIAPRPSGLAPGQLASLLSVPVATVAQESRGVPQPALAAPRLAGKKTNREITPALAAPSAGQEQEEEEEEVTDNGRPKRRGTQRVPTFPLKLYDLIIEAENEGKAHIVSFTSNGRSFRIHEVERFMTELVPQYFRNQKKFCSFRRQLSMYGFDRVPFGPDEGKFSRRLHLLLMSLLCLTMDFQNRCVHEQVL
jgi:hypothetical protein